jgi:hypothetical protein
MPAFRRWFAQRLDWKAVHQRNFTEPDSFYQATVLKKLVVAWRRFSSEEKAFKSLIETAKQARIDRLISNGLKAWLGVAEEADKSKFELALRRFPDFQPRVLVAARKCGLIWRQKVKPSHTGFSPVSRLQREGRRSLNTERLLMSLDVPARLPSDERTPTGKRKAPRKPSFIINEENRIVEIKENQLPSKPELSEVLVATEIPSQKEDSSQAPKKTEISIQTDPEVPVPVSVDQSSLPHQDSKSNIDRQDSGIDVNTSVSVGTEATLEKSGSVLALEKILSNIPEDECLECLPIAVEETPKPAMGVQEIESKLLGFQALKTRYLQNKTRIGQVQLEIHDMLFGRTCGDLDIKTQELEKMRQQVKEYEDSADARNQEIILLSMQIQYFLKQQPEYF